MANDKSSDILNCATAVLSSGIITDILSRLPVKALVRFKSVSKSWRSLIRNPRLAQLHARKSLESHSNILLIVTTGSDLFSQHLDELADPNRLKVTDSKHLFCVHPTPLADQIVGSCNGLICTVLFERSIFWENPLTGYCRDLPNSGKGFTFLDDDHWVSFGFGQDIVNGDYKVVRIDQINNDEDNTPISTEVNVFNSRTESWKRADQDFPCFLDKPRVHGKLANGSLHWLVSRNSRSIYKKVVVAFNLSNENYSFIRLPYYRDKLNPALSLGVIGQCLYLQVDYDTRDNKRCVEVWVMKEPGVGKSWYKLLQFDYEGVLGNSYRLRPLAFSEGEGQVLLEQRCWFKDEERGNAMIDLTLWYLWYDLGNGTIRRIPRPQIPRKFAENGGISGTEVVSVGSLVCA